MGENLKCSSSIEIVPKLYLRTVVNDNLVTITIK